MTTPTTDWEEREARWEKRLGEGCQGPWCDHETVRSHWVLEADELDEILTQQKEEIRGAVDEIKSALDEEISNYGTELTGQFREGWIAGMRLAHVIALKKLQDTTGTAN